MESLPLKPETAAKLEALARMLGRDPVALGDQALEDWLEREREETEETRRGVERGLADMQAGRTRPAADVLAELRRKHEIPG